MIGRLIAGILVVGLAIGVWALWPRGEPDTSSTTTIAAVATSTSTSTSTSVVVATTVEDTTTTMAGSHVVTTKEEAEEILRELWFGWFEGIYNQDEERIKEVVGSQAFFDAALDAFESLEFVQAPSRGGIVFSNVEVLRSDEECLVTWTESSADEFLGPGPLREGVDVMRWIEGSWRLVSTWTYKDDLWEADCESQLDSSL